MIQIDPECVQSSSSDTAAEYTCSVCQCIVLNAVETATCGHMFCKLCLDQWLAPAGKIKAKPTCPECRGALPANDGKEAAYTVSKNLRRKIDNLTIKCASRSPHCKWKGSIGEFLSKHVKECTEVRLACPDCDITDIANKDWIKHHDSQCVNRITTCVQCGKPNVKMKEHENECPFRQVKCKDCKVKIAWNVIQEHSAFDCMSPASACAWCKSVVPNVHMFSHFQQSCPKKPTMCAFCRDIVIREERKAHLLQCPALLPTTTPVTQSVTAPIDIPVAMPTSVPAPIEVKTAPIAHIAPMPVMTQMPRHKPLPTSYGAGRWQSHGYGRGYGHGHGYGHGYGQYPPFEPPKECIHLWSDVKGTYEVMEILAREEGHLVLHKPGCSSMFDQVVHCGDARLKSIL